jgi:Family of unknown function (DUF5677)
MPYFLYIDHLAREIRAKVFLEEEQGLMTIEAALESSASLSKWLDDSIHGLHIPSGDRESMTGSLFDQVHEHHKAIQLLLKNSLVGSAFSLLRPTFENYVRGVWLLRCASDEEVEEFTQDRIAKSFGILIEEIERNPGYNGAVLSRVKEKTWRAMCSYAHGGFLPVVRRIIPGEITTNYSDEEKLEVIESSDTIALLAASEMFQMANRIDLVQEVLERMSRESITPE